MKTTSGGGGSKVGYFARVSSWSTGEKCIFQGEKERNGRGRLGFLSINHLAGTELQPVRSPFKSIL